MSKETICWIAGSPLRINLLLHAYAIQSPYPFPSPAATEEEARLVEEGLTQEIGSRVEGRPVVYGTTRMGEAIVRAMLETGWQVVARPVPVLPL